ncbi:hypothetical protein HHI36_024341, partial [Cryptolaemus montrouzieri]
MEKYHFTISKGYNVDDVCVTTVQDPGTVLAEKGQAGVASLPVMKRVKTNSSKIFFCESLAYEPVLLTVDNYYSHASNKECDLSKRSHVMLNITLFDLAHILNKPNCYTVANQKWLS